MPCKQDKKQKIKRAEFPCLEKRTAKKKKKTRRVTVQDHKKLNAQSFHTLKTGQQKKQKIKRAEFPCLGKKPATCRTCGKTFPGPNVTLSDFLLAKSERKKGNRSRNSSPGMSRRSPNVSPAMSRKSSVVSWSDSPRGQSEANGEDAVMEDGTETHQSRDQQEDQGERQIAENSHEHARRNTGRSSTGTVTSGKCNRWMMRKLPCWQPKGNSYPCKVGSINRRTIWSEFRKRSNRNRKKRLEILQKWMEADQELEAANAKQLQATREMALLVAGQTAENTKKLSISEIQGFSLTRQDPFLIKLHNKPFSQCSNPFS